MRDLALAIEKQHSGQVTAEGCLKTPDDLTRYRAIIDRTRPDSILETGTFSGKSALWFAHQAGAPRVLTIDVTHQHVDAPTRQAAERAGVLFYEASSTDERTIRFVHMWAMQAGRTMVVLDSDHRAAHVKAEMDAYGPIVTPGCYLVVEDGIIRWIPFELDYYGGTGPLDAIEAWMPDHPEFQVDRHVEDMLPQTQFPGGWLRRAA